MSAIVPGTREDENMSISHSSERLATVLAWIEAHADAAIADLQDFCRQPSISAQDTGIREMAEMVAQRLWEMGAETNQVVTARHPVVVGRLEGQRTRRLAFYNHYDVQPPEPLDAWETPPFASVVRDGKLYARGVADNKGNLVARLWATRAWQEAGSLPCGLTFLVEGEEEIGSPSLERFAAEHQELLQVDACLWETGYRNEQGTITITAGLKGLLAVELHVRTVGYDLHSSNAPLAPNAAWRLIEALGTLRDSSGRVLIPGFYDAVRPPTEGERRLLERFPLDVQALRANWQTEQLLMPGDDAVALTEHLLYSPTCNICGIWSGYTGVGSKTVLPATAAVKIDFRLVPDQDPEVILALLKRHLSERGFADIEVVDMADSALPAQSSMETPLVATLARAARVVYGVEPHILPRRAGTGPMELLCLRYGLPVVNGAGVGYDGSRVHSPNEHIRLEDFLLNIKLIAVLLAEFASAEETV
jgi:acetylornithine deacetylase/succinyl-diaminopimelate desuccinylase-like protein